MVTGLSSLFQRRELLFAWTARGIRARYKQTLLGGAWAVIQPVAMMIVFSVIFDRFLSVDTGDTAYPIFSYTALLPWTLFSTGVIQATGSLVDNMSLVTKVYFPREIFPLSSIGARLVDFGIAAFIFIGMVIFFRVDITLTWLWVPLILTVQLMLMVGLGLFGATVTVFFRDVRHAIQLIMQLWMYASPIIYPITAVPDRYLFWYSLNPIVGIIEAYRNVLLHGESPPWNLFVPSIVISVLVFVAGFAYFKRMEWQFGDII